MKYVTLFFDRFPAALTGLVVLTLIFLVTFATSVWAKDDTEIRKAYLEDRIEIASEEYKALEAEYLLAKTDRDAAQLIMDQKAAQMASLASLNASRRAELKTLDPSFQ